MVIIVKQSVMFGKVSSKMKSNSAQKVLLYLVKKLVEDKKICESKSQIELLNRDDLIVVVYTYSSIL